MDRLPRLLVVFGLGLIVVAPGCRSTKSEVPPGRPFAKDGQQRKAIEFSSDGHPVNGAASVNIMPNNVGGSNLASGIGSNGGRPDVAAFGAPPGSYGPPGTSGMGQPGTIDPATTRTSEEPTDMPPPGIPPLETPPASSSPAAPAPNATTPRDVQPAPNPIIIPPMEKPGAMGTPDQMPSPM